jgi:hypothetical protein
MKILPILWSFLPWIVVGIDKYLLSGNPADMAPLLFVISPFVTLGIGLTAYREGQLSRNS